MRQSRQFSSLYASNRSCHLEADTQAYRNTRVVVQQHRKLRDNNPSWIPKGIDNENSPFSQVPLTHKPMRKPASANISISIFDLGPDFKPSVRRTEFSTRNSNIFTDQQTETVWRSSSKRVDAPTSRQLSRTKCYKQSVMHSGKKCSVDLSWDTSSRKVQKAPPRSLKNYLYCSVRL